MTPTHISLLDGHTIRIEGKGSLRESLERDYEWFQRSKAEGADLVCRMKTDPSLDTRWSKTDD
jgi:hypothetical protein